MVAMKRLTVLISVGVLVVSLLLAPSAAASAPTPPPGPAGPSVYVGDLTAAQLGELFSSGLDRSEVVTGPGATSRTVHVEAILGQQQWRDLVAAGVPLTEKIIAGAGAQSRMQQRTASGYQVFRSYSEPGGIRDEYLAVAAANPRLVKVVVIGKTVQGQDIIALKVTKDANWLRDGKRPAVLYSSAQHAREWITPEMNRRLLHYYLDNYAGNRDIRKIIDTTELWFVPVANPDGYDFTFTEGNRLWRKNLQDNDGDGVITGNDGVDPNRNYPTKWGYDNEGSSDQPSSEVFRGKSPGSEPETKALDGLMRRIKFSFLVNYHSAAELLLYGVGFQVATPTPDDIVYEALAGDDANPAIPGYDPDIAAELYITNGETTEHAHVTYGTLGFTPEMSTCETASASDPDDQFDPADCDSVFNFPDSEALVQAEFEKNIPFALSVAESAADPSNPVSSVGREVADFVVDAFDVSYGNPQPVAVTARRDISDLTLRYSINGGRAQQSRVQEWRGGERYGTGYDVYYGEFRGTIRETKPGDKVEVWFTGKKQSSNHGHAVGDRGWSWGGRQVESEHFTYSMQQDGNSVLVLANEDYEGVNPTYPAGTPTPKYAQQYVDDLAAAGISSAVWDVSKQGVPHDLGVLDHFKAVIWYLGDNRLTQDPADELTDFFGGLEPDLSVAERQQYLTLSVRDYLNAGGKLAYTGETAGFYGQLGSALGGIYYGLNGAPEQPCVVTDDPFSDCLLLADDFTQYYLGAYSRSPRSEPASLEGLSAPFAGTTAAFAVPAANPLDEPGTFLPTSFVLPPQQFPLFNSTASSRYLDGSPSGYETFEGDWYVRGLHSDNSYMRLNRTIDLTATTAAQTPTLGLALAFDTEPGYDNVIFEARTVGQDDWTTLPEKGGLTDTDVPDECDAGFLVEEHPFLEHYLTVGADACDPTGTTGQWNRMTADSGGWQNAEFDLSSYSGRQVEVAVSYVTDSSAGGAGVFVDQTSLTVGGAPVDTTDFETDLGPWTIPGPPPGSPAEAGDFVRSMSPVGASITTPDTVLLGFGLEQIGDQAQRVALTKSIIKYLAPRVRH